MSFFSLEYIFPQVLVFNDFLQRPLHQCACDLDLLGFGFGYIKHDILQNGRHYGVQASRADILRRFIKLCRHLRDFLDGALLKDNGDSFGLQQSRILLDQRIFGSNKIRTKSPSFNESNSTRMGKRPCNSGIKSDGFVE